MSCTRVYEWHKSFKSGCDDAEDDQKPGCPTISRNEENIQNVNKLVHSDRRMPVRMLAEKLGLGMTILMEDLGMRKICTKMVPKLLSDDHKARHVDLSQDVLDDGRYDDVILETRPGSSSMTLRQSGRASNGR